ncbi:MAG: hypothetical protein ACO3A2_02960 [Bdellovibrionia bacterium]
MESLLISFLNFSILIAVLFYKTKGPIRQYVLERHELIKKELESVRQELQQAQERYDEFSAKLKAVDAEVQNLREQRKQDSQIFQQRTQSDARRLSSMSISDARDVAAGLFADLKNQLYTEFSLQVLDRAEVLISQRLTKTDQLSIQKEFSRQLETFQEMKKQPETVQ